MEPQGAVPLGAEAPMPPQPVELAEVIWAARVVTSGRAPPLFNGLSFVPVETQDCQLVVSETFRPVGEVKSPPHICWPPSSQATT